MLIAICGTIGSGKSLSADFLKRRYDFQEYSFAEPLKKIGLCFGFEIKELYGSQQEKLEINNFWGISGREFLQKFGTDICRNVLPEKIPNMNLQNKSIWIRLFEKYYENKKTENIVISDLRFLDEAEAIKRLGGIIIKISRSSVHTSSHTSSHASEREVQEIVADFTIHNDSSIEELYEKINNIINLKKMI